MKGRWRLWAAIIAGFLVLVLALAASSGVSYGVASYQYRKLVVGSPDSRLAVERRLWFSSQQAMECSDSAWTQGYSDEPDRRCRRYMVLGREPIDVVYDGQENVIAILSAFE